MNYNNHYHRYTLTANKNRHRQQEQTIVQIPKVQSNKNANLISSILFPGISNIYYSITLESYENEPHLHLINHSIDVNQQRDRSGSKKRLKTEVVRPNYYLYRKFDQPSSQLPKLIEREDSYKKKKQIQPNVAELDNSPICIRHLNQSVDCNAQSRLCRNLTPIQKRTIDISKSQSKSDHLNQEEIMQFSFGLQYNRMSREKQRTKFPREVFVGDVRKVKRIFQQQ